MNTMGENKQKMDAKHKRNKKTQKERCKEKKDASGSISVQIPEREAGLAQNGFGTWFSLHRLLAKTRRQFDGIVLKTLQLIQATWRNSSLDRSSYFSVVCLGVFGEYLKSNHWIMG